MLEGNRTSDKQGVIDAIKSFDGRAGVASTLVEFARGLIVKDNPEEMIMSNEDYEQYQQWKDNRTPFETFDFNKEELIDKQFENDDMPF